MTALTTAMVLPIVIDLLAMLILVGALYYPRHRRADLVVAFFVVNIGVLAVASVMANSTISAGLGLGLFGVLSIIRLRSDEISQREIAYYRDLLICNGRIGPCHFGRWRFEADTWPLGLAASPIRPRNRRRAGTAPSA